MADAIVDVIQKLGLDASAVHAELDAIKNKYQASNKELEQTQKVLDTLTAKEAKLLEGRKASNNPTVVAAYNRKLEETRKSIEINERAVKSLSAETVKYQKELDRTASKAKAAFDATTVNANQKATSGLSSQLLSVAGGLGVATGVGALAAGIKDAVTDAVILESKAEGIRTAFSRIGGEKSLEKLREATRGAASDVDLMAKALRARNFGIDTNLLAKGLELAGKTARETGQDVNYLADSFVDGVGRKSLLILDNLQISQTKLRAEIKKTGDFQTAVLNIVNEKLKEQGVVIESTADKLARYKVGWENLKTKAGEFFVETAARAGRLFDVLTSSQSFSNIIDKGVLERQQKEFQEFSGATLDTARESEEKRLKLLAESSTRVVEFNQLIANQVSQKDIDLVNKRLETATGFDKKRLIKERENLEELLKLQSTSNFNYIRLKLQNEKKLNDDLRNLNKKRTEDFDEEGAKRMKKEREFLENLEIDIRKAQSVLRGQTSANSLNSEISELDKIDAKFVELSIQKNIDFEKRRDQIQDEIKDEAIKQKALVNLKLLENIELNQLDNQRLTDIRDTKFKQAAAAIEGAKSVAEIELKTEQALTTFTLDDSDERIAILVDYTSKKIQLMQQEGKDEIDILKFSLEQALAIEEIRKQQFLKIKKQSNAEFEEEERFHLAMLEYKRRIHQSQITTSEIKFEEEQLKQMRADYDAQVALTGKQDQEQLLAVKKQEDDIALLKKKQKKQERQEIIDQTLFVIDNINKITEATLRAGNQLLDAEVSKVDKLIGLQQQRVDAVAQIAERGNAELLELEKKRLDDLNKQKEKFVRTQQTLATIELVANTAVAVSKAAAEGGAGAAFTIAAALIALIAGLASARSIAGQAAFFSGGESDSGFTGNGNIHDQSMAVGPKPYIYHKKEFIFDNKNTAKYLDIFRQVHKGDLDLNQMKFESDMYRTLKENKINTQRDVVYRPLESGSSLELNKLKATMENVVKAIEGQPGMEVHINDEGIYTITNRYYRNKKRIDNLTR